MYASPQHFIVRPGDQNHQDTFVPLIATDELPDWIRLAGAPRELDAEHAAGLTNLGVLVKSEGSCYEASLRHDVIQSILQGAEEEQEEDGEQNVGSMEPKLVQQPNKASGTREHPPARLTRAQAKAKKAMVPESICNAAQESGSALPSSTTTLIQHKTKASKNPKQKQQKSRHGIPQQSRRPVAPLASCLDPTLAPRHNNTRNIAKNKSCIPPLVPPHSTEEHEQRDNNNSMIINNNNSSSSSSSSNTYCRHWCHHGTCKWGLECRYTHRMPTTLEGLREVGLKTLPLWYNLFVMNELLGEDLGINPSTRLINDNNNTLNVALPLAKEGLLAHAEEAEEAALAHQTQLSPHHHHHRRSSSADVSVVQSRIAALLTGNSPALVDNNDDDRQQSLLREMSKPRHSAHTAALLSSLPLMRHRSLDVERTARSSHHQPQTPIMHERTRGGPRSRRHQARANLHTNASLAANAADLSAASHRRTAEPAANKPVTMSVPLETRDKPRTRGGMVGPYDELENQLSPAANDGDVAKSHRRPEQGQQQLVDVE